MKRRLLFLIGAAAMLAGCVSARANRRDVLVAYRKGFRVGRVVGRDDVIGELKSPDCWTQSVNELMNPAKEPAELAEPQGGKSK